MAIQYDLELPPVIAIRIQEVYGEQQSPIIANGQLPVVMELLSPAHRPIQKHKIWRHFGLEVIKRCKRDERTLPQAFMA